MRGEQKPHSALVEDFRLVRNGMGISDLKRRAALDRIEEQLQTAQRELDAALNSTMHQENYDAACLRADEAEEELQIRTTLYDQLVREHARLREQYGTLHLAAEAVFRSGYESPSGMGGRYVNAQDMDALGAVLYPASKPLFDRDPSLPVGLHVGDDFTEVTDPASERES